MTMKDINFYMNLDYPYEITPEEAAFAREILDGKKTGGR